MLRTYLPSTTLDWRASLPCFVSRRIALGTTLALDILY